MEPEVAGGGPAPQASSSVSSVRVADVISSTVGAGDARLKMTIRTVMPEAFDDGVPQRRFTGTGILDQSQDLAGITYKLGPVPNAAGYFGQADGKTSVYYSEDAFILSFPLLVTALAGPTDWFRYEVDDFAIPRLRKLGIGQLREIGLSDPRLALALLRGGPEELSQTAGGTPAPAAPVYRFTSDVALAAGAEGNTLETPFAALEDLGVDSVNVSLTLDEEQALQAITYKMAYPPAPGSRDVKLAVEIEFLEFGLEGDLTLPPEETIADYEEYLAR